MSRQPNFIDKYLFASALRLHPLSDAKCPWLRPRLEALSDANDSGICDRFGANGCARVC